MISQISLRKSFPKSFSFISESVAEFAPFNFTTWQLETVCTRQTTKYIVYSKKKKQSMHAFSSQLTSKKNHFLFFPSWSVDPNGQMSCHKPNSSLQPPHRKKKKKWHFFVRRQKVWTLTGKLLKVNLTCFPVITN